MIRKIIDQRLFRYLVAGGTAASVSLFTLFVLTHYFKLWYMLSAFFAFSAGFGVSFVLQKAWTFGKKTLEGIKKQLVLYLLTFIIGNALNMLFMYLLVEYSGLHYLMAQIVSNGLIAFGNFFVYKYFVFI